MELLQLMSTDGNIKVYSAPGNNLVVPSLTDKSHSCPVQLVHLRNLKCPLNKCKDKKSKLHTLSLKEPVICIHSLLGQCALNKQVISSKSSTKRSTTEKIPKLERNLTVEFVLEKLAEVFPTLSAEKNSFLQNNRKFVDEFKTSKSINEEMIKNSLHHCPICPN